MSGAVPQLVDRVKSTPSENWPPRLFEALCRSFLQKQCRLVVSGALPHGDSPYLLCSNHASHMDAIAIMIASGVPFSSCALLAAQDYFFRTRPGPSVLAMLLSLIPVNRSGIHGFRNTLQSSGRFIASGGRLIVAFPEGTRGDGRTLRPFKRGPALLSMRLGLPVVPVWIGGTHNIMPKGRLLPRRGTVLVAFGDVLQPVDPNEAISRRIQSIVMTSKIRHAVRALARSHGFNNGTDPT
jgi:1-acyl-sn-glycerol-3-phosphate acyltransferase